MAKTLHYDGIVIGAGHNGMICAGYLGKSGQKILVVEKNMEVGGGLDSHEDRNYPGFWHNIHSVFHRGLMMLPWFQDLEMERMGIHYYKPDPGVVQHFLDRTYLGWFADVERTIATIEQFSPKDAASFRDIWTRWQPVVKNIVFPETYCPPIPISEKRPLLEGLPEGREYLRYFDTTPEQFILEHFEHTRVRAFIGFLAVMRGYELDAPNTGYLVPAMIAWGVNPQLCRGTSHALGDNLAHMLSHNGVDYIEAVGVERILVDGGRATGVVLEDGTVVHAKTLRRLQRQPGGDLHQARGSGKPRLGVQRQGGGVQVLQDHSDLRHQPGPERAAALHHRGRAPGGGRQLHAHRRAGYLRGPAQPVR